MRIVVNFTHRPHSNQGYEKYKSSDDFTEKLRVCPIANPILKS